MKRIFLILLILAITALTAMADSVTKSITAQNTWTNAIFPKYMPESSSASLGHSVRSYNDYGALQVAAYGFGSATVTLQAAFDFGTAWVDTGTTYTSDTVETITCYAPGVSFRIGVKTGDYTSGTINVRIDD